MVAVPSQDFQRHHMSWFFWGLVNSVIVCFVDIVGNDDHHYLKLSFHNK